MYCGDEKGQVDSKDRMFTDNAKISPEDTKESSDSSESELDESDTEEGVVEFDGLSNVISKIVNQNVSKEVPVLEKRKVTNVNRKDSKGSSDEGQALPPKKKSKLSREIVELTPEEIQDEQARVLTSLTKEKNLKKIATKGVIALFNAIMESKRRADGDEEGVQSERQVTSSLDKEAINSKVKNLTKSKFLELISGNQEGSSKKSDAMSEGSQEEAGASSGKADNQRGWDVLADDDDYGQHEADLKLKDWDKSSDED